MATIDLVSAPQLTVPTPGEPVGPIVPDAPVVPSDPVPSPDPAPPGDPIPPSVPEPDPEVDVTIDPPEPPQTV
jgi:hypothetical protein